VGSADDRARIKEVGRQRRGCAFAAGCSVRNTGHKAALLGTAEHRDIQVTLTNVLSANSACSIVEAPQDKVDSGQTACSLRHRRRSQGKSKSDTAIGTTMVSTRFRAGGEPLVTHDMTGFQQLSLEEFGSQEGIGGRNGSLDGVVRADCPDLDCLGSSKRRTSD